jgi:two-component system, OmpR family, phosphate regulon sensor histidine kinase PhoR
MDAPGATRIKRLRRNLKLTGAIVLLAVGVLVPVLLSTLVGILTIVLGTGSQSIILGVLTISFTSAAVGSAIILTVLLGRRSATARLQADFVANVTHELRTPLSAIRMYAQTLQLGVLDGDVERTRTSVDTIIRETEWLEAMIDRVLTWRAAAQDRFDVDLVSEPLGPVVQEVATRFRRMLPPGEVDFEVQNTSESPVLHDKNGLESMMLNLLTNAYKYTGADKRITLEVTDEKDTVIVAVIDNGVGIPEREHGRIFDPFYRVESGRGGKASGAGLGLAIVRHMALVHRGQVFVESAAGKGSRFSIHLPMATDDDEEEEKS